MEEQVKKCFKCGKIKPLSQFYKHAKMKDGHVNKCIDCNKNDVRGNYTDNILNPQFVEKERKRGREKGKRLYSGTHKANRASNIKYEVKYPEKILAKSGCSKLKKPGFEKHHWSYNKEHYKDIIWLTKQSHMKAHRFLIYDQERMMYRKFDTLELLDTKERHETFILHCVHTYDD